MIPAVHPTRAGRRRSSARRAVLVAMIVLLAGCGSGGSPSMLDAKGNEARHIAGVWWLMFGLAIGVYSVVGAFIVVAIVRGRHGRRPSRIRDDAFVWIGGVIVPVVILAVIGVVTVRTTAALRGPQPNPVRIEVRGENWWWRVRYPGTGISTANELHVPTNEPIDVVLTSDTVIHSFWVPQIAGKMDVIPGQTNVLRFRVEQPGSYRGECAEFCGIQHANMAFRVIAESPGLFRRWEADQAAPPREPTSELAARGAVAFERLPCSGCHTVDGTQAAGTRGPDLTNLGSRSTIGAGVAENTPANLERWIRDAPALKPGVLMPKIAMTDADARSIVAYLESLR